MAALQPNWLLSHRSSRGTRARYTRSARVTLRDRVQSDSLRASLSLYSPCNSFSLSSASPSPTYAQFRRARSHREIRGFEVEWVMQMFACPFLSCGFYRFENYNSDGNFVNFNWTMDLRNFLLRVDANKPRIWRIRIRSNISTVHPSSFTIESLGSSRVDQLRFNCTKMQRKMMGYFKLALEYTICTVNELCASELFVS